MKSFVTLAALAALGYAAVELSRKLPVGVTDAEPLGPQPLRAGVPYLFQVRLTSSGDPVGEMAAEDVLKSKGASMIVFSPAILPPFWSSPGAAFSTRVASFKVTPQGNATVTMGQDFYAIGRLEKVARLDGQPFAAPGPYDAPNEGASV